jgi:hypothetical protein
MCDEMSIEVERMQVYIPSPTTHPKMLHPIHMPSSYVTNVTDLPAMPTHPHTSNFNKYNKPACNTHETWLLMHANN